MVIVVNKRPMKLWKGGEKMTYKPLWLVCFGMLTKLFADVSYVSLLVYGGQTKFLLENLSVESLLIVVIGWPIGWVFSLVFGLPHQYLTIYIL